MTSSGIGISSRNTDIDAATEASGLGRALRHITAALPPATLLAIRAAVADGPEFAIEQVAARLDLSPVRLLECLQMAADAGIAIRERGAGRLALPPEIAAWVRASTLPALAATWAPPAQKDTRVTTPEGANPAPGAPASADEPVRHTAPRIGREHAHRTVPEAPAPSASYEELFDRTDAAAQEGAMSSEEITRDPSAPDPAVAAATVPESAPSEATNATEPEPEVTRLLSLAREAAATGNATDALAHARQALVQVERLPAVDARKRLHARVLCEMARLQWQAAGPGSAFTLRGAFETALSARALTADEDPPLRAHIAGTLAGISYDLGDLRSLERALDEVSDAVRVLTRAGEAQRAARLLNDQAALYLRLGDPVRAAYLLEQSRAVFEHEAASDPTALRETADTDHLLARLPLSAAIRPGREADALAMARERSLSAEEAYRQLGDARAMAHVWETMARIEIKGGRPERAAERLSAAMQAQSEVGDVVGLARSTAAMAEVLSHAGRHSDALSLLADSVAFNLEKGSPIGLAFNRRDLDALRAAPGVSREAVAAVASRLVAAEQLVGAVTLAGAHDRDAIAPPSDDLRAGI